MRGGDSSGLRAYNERLILNAILRAGALSKAEIARATGLSGQAASVIVNRLLEDGLLIKRDKVRGQVGQPSTPIAANPSGAFSLGVKIGRRSVDAVLVNLLGEVIASRSQSYRVPYPEATVETAARQANGLLAELDEARRERVVGLGIAMPGELHGWATELGLAADALAGWREIDAARALEEATGLSSALYNDGTAACAAEMIVGDGIVRRSALYVYLGTFIGGGVVLDGRLYRGEQLNAGAIGSMPTCAGDPQARPEQLIHRASVIALERVLEAAGIEAASALSGADLPAAEPIFEAWAEGAVAVLARSVVSALAVIDFEAVVVDGLLPPSWRRRFTLRLAEALEGFDWTGLQPAEILPGSIGPMARVLGAAMLPLKARFSPDAELVVRSVASLVVGPNGAAGEASA
ncbi:Sugar kinase of the NBD/HSP70 family, may contain an N-terminal HTH domain [Tistlia consotensis]|uniref:Sugar kinase of the NBD/HSP70 family, may contain an N-terminal HTH domain n=1 Tax=Tistlia consotensis USBA 355 TaxID=560819 RepID=A0A1Y6C209_9PROT|nr:ROK family transcriptional regulator [Tistlia consotensis]SMF29478.1 Sugar kinase of the NBD/HSP70 family, may contain an N-terminal HTH domain [Tistlia consotensis USBA 355]SNR91249.1 Sugar kinase of the NBD/HSP70 family, may contain an N-terminal HTH domain [Tistlia consotensis]